MKHKHKWEVENLQIGDFVLAMKICRACKTIKEPIYAGVTTRFVIQGSRAEAERNSKEANKEKTT